MRFEISAGSGDTPGQGRIQPVRLGKSHYGFTAVGEMKYTSQQCYNKTVDGKMAFYRECCFPNCPKSW